MIMHAAPTLDRPRQRFQIEWIEYYSLIELAAELRRLDDRSGHSLTVLLGLDESFSGRLTSLIQRRTPGFRLTLAKLSGTFWLPVSAGDLAAASQSLGWQQIVVEKSFSPALEGTLRSMESGQRLVIFWPNWRDGLAFKQRCFGGVGL
jgi:hypothetical protein